MKSVDGFEILELLHRGAKTQVVRARREADGADVVLKLLVAEFPGADDVAGIRSEFALGREAPVDAAVAHHSLIERGAFGIALEDFGARSLRDVVDPRGVMPLKQLLDVATRAARCLAALHSAGIVHRDVSPGNILLNVTTGEVKLCDFGLASALPRTTQAVCPPGRLAGTLAYLSPEQTGRMNRSIDHRTDLYGLGATLYHLATGRPPFEETDALALLHAHIAKASVPAHERNPEIPVALSRLISRLLEKAAEARYQSAEGVANDLAAIASAQESGGGSGDDFVLGQTDDSPLFHVSQRLYGRDDEIRRLMDAFSRVADGERGLVLVRGFSGIGKSSLIREVHRPIVARRGYFASGKYDQLTASTPLSAVRAALRDIVVQLLGESEEQVAGWRSRLGDALGDLGQVAVDFVPELGLLLGPQAAVLELAGAEARKRFDRVLLDALAAIATADHPLVLFLDDLQWIDPASLRLLEALARSEQHGHVLLVGAYRDNEVGPDHPLSLTLDSLQRDGVTMDVVELGPLGLTEVAALAAETLGQSATEVRPLATLVHQKTGGNPFFVTQFLRDLADEGLVRRVEGRWTWDIAAVRRLEAIDTAVGLMLEKIRRYRADASHALGMAAFLGSDFSLARLATVLEKPAAETMGDLWPGLHDGLILPLDTRWRGAQAGHDDDARFRFAHDRIQEAAMSIVPAAEQPALRLRVGRLLRDRVPPSERAERVFEFVHHLQHAESGDLAPGERRELATLFAAAAGYARRATDYTRARDFVLRSLALRTENHWDEDPDAAFDLHRSQIELEFLCGNIQEGEALFRRLAERTLTEVQTAEIYQLMIRIHLTADRPAEGLALGVEGLGLLGVLLPTEEAAAASAMDEERARLAAAIDGMTADDLVTLPALDDPRIEMIMGLLHETWTCGVMASDITQMIHTALKLVRLSAEHGNTKFSACGHVAHALVLSLSGQYADAKFFGEISMRLAHRFEDPFIIPKVHNTFGNFTNHWIAPIRTNEAIYEESYRNCLLSGDRWWGAWAVGWMRTTRFVGGFPLDEVLDTQERFHEYIEESGYVPLTAMSSLDRALVLRLMDRGHDRTGHFQEVFQTMGFPFGLYLVHLYRAFDLWLHGDTETLWSEVQAATEVRDAIPGLMPYADYFFYTALIACGEAERAPQRRSEALEHADACVERMELWSREACAENFAHRLALMRAELARVRGEDASHLYEEAIERAGRDGYLQNQAIAAELAGRFHLAAGRPARGGRFLAQAEVLFERWGATRKVAQLRARFGDYLPTPAATRRFDSFTTTTSQTLSGSEIDGDAILKACRAISSEIALDKLLERILGVVVEVAGARRVVVALLDTERLWVRAEGQLVAGSSGENLAVDLELNEPVASFGGAPSRTLRYVARSGSPVLEDDPSAGALAEDPYVRRALPRSLACVPLRSKGQVFGVLYLENDQTPGAFTTDRLDVLEVLCAQFGIAYENARLYDGMEREIARQTVQLRHQNDRLEQALADLHAAQGRLVHAEKMASLGAFTAGVAHELNNPLNFVNNFAQVGIEMCDELEEEPSPEERREIVTDLRENLSAIQRNGARAAGIVGTMVRHAGGSGGDRTATDLNSVLRRHADVPDGVELQLDLQANLGTVPLISQEMATVVKNLVDNAAEAAASRAEAGGPPAQVWVRSTRDSASVRFSVADNGGGVPPGLEQRIFEPFFTTRAGHQGSGLGLSLCYNIVVEGHGGRIELDTGATGTTFTVVLPAPEA